jgi:hypothetical protein
MVADGNEDNKSETENEYKKKPKKREVGKME